MKFSVIIPAYNEEVLISNAVKTVIANQKFIPRKEIEIIVVDNGSIDRTNQRAIEAGADKVVSESKKGTNFARQRGFLESKGEIVAFLDVDCIVPENWLLLIKERIAKGKFFAVSGPYDYQLKGFRQLISNLWQKFFCPKVPKILYFLFHKKTGMIVNGNWAAKRETIQKIGGIPPAKFEGDDAFIANLISRNVGPILFDPKLTVKTSGRRFEKEGFIRTALIYNINYLGVYFKNRPLIVGKQKDIR